MTTTNLNPRAEAGTQAPVYQRIVLKLSGESLQGAQGYGIDAATVVAIARELGLPIRFVGTGEKIDDLVPFDADDYVNALFVDRW